MALSAGKWFTAITCIDSSGKKAIREYEHFDTDYQWIPAAAVAIRERFELVSDCKVVQVQTSLVRVEESLTLPTVGFVEDVLVITAPVKDDARSQATVSIPAPKVGLFMSSTGVGRDQVNWAIDSYLKEYLRMFDQPYFLLSDGEQIDRVNLKGRRVRRKTYDP